MRKCGAPGDRNLSVHVYYVLTLATIDAPPQRMENTSRGERLLAWRSFCRQHEPTVAARYIGMVSRIALYELQSSEKIPANILGVILQSGLWDESLTKHLIFNAGCFKSYVEMRAEIENVLSKIACARPDAHFHRRLRQGQRQGQGQGPKEQAGKSDAKSEGKTAQMGNGLEKCSYGKSVAASVPSGASTAPCIHHAGSSNTNSAKRRFCCDKVGREEE